MTDSKGKPREDRVRPTQQPVVDRPKFRRERPRGPWKQAPSDNPTPEPELPIEDSPIEDQQ